MRSNAATYSIIDEPKASPLAHLAVNPVWPLLAVMFGGAWISWSWFVLNGYALGSPTRHREATYAAGGLIGSILILLALGVAGAQGLVSDVGLRYLLVGLTVWKLAISYWLYTLQARTFGLWQYFGGQAKSGLLVVFAAAFLGARFLSSLPDWWQLVLR